MKKQKGISLIVLVITILVMIILAGVVIVSLQQSNPIQKAKFARMVDSLGSVRGAISQYAANAQAHDSVETDMKNLVNEDGYLKAGNEVVKDGKTVKDLLGVDPTPLLKEGKIKVDIKTGRTEYELTTDAYDEQIKETKPEGIIPSEGINPEDKPNPEYEEMLSTLQNIEKVMKEVTAEIASGDDALGNQEYHTAQQANRIIKKVKEKKYLFTPIDNEYQLDAPLVNITEIDNAIKQKLINQIGSIDKIIKLQSNGKVLVNFKRGTIKYKLTSDWLKEEIRKNKPNNIIVVDNYIDNQAKRVRSHLAWNLDKKIEKTMYFSFKINWKEASEQNFIIQMLYNSKNNINKFTYKITGNWKGTESSNKINNVQKDKLYVIKLNLSSIPEELNKDNIEKRIYISRESDNIDMNTATITNVRLSNTLPEGVTKVDNEFNLNFK